MGCGASAEVSEAERQEARRRKRREEEGVDTQTQQQHHRPQQQAAAAVAPVKSDNPLGNQQQHQPATGATAAPPYHSTQPAASKPDFGASHCAPAPPPPPTTQQPGGYTAMDSFIAQSAGAPAASNNNTANDEAEPAMPPHMDIAPLGYGNQSAGAIVFTSTSGGDAEEPLPPGFNPAASVPLGCSSAAQHHAGPAQQGAPSPPLAAQAEAAGDHGGTSGAPEQGQQAGAGGVLEHVKNGVSSFASSAAGALKGVFGGRK